MEDDFFVSEKMVNQHLGQNRYPISIRRRLYVHSHKTCSDTKTCPKNGTWKNLQLVPTVEERICLSREASVNGKIRSRSDCVEPVTWRYFR